jgi:hypothetical protein
MNAKEFNEKFIVGEKVLVTNDFGNIETQQIKSAGWDIQSGSTLVKLSGFYGGYDVDRVSKALNTIEPSTNQPGE